ncbi:NCS2 family permease [Petrocella sp. FN5]|uniref:NCS2 family permease n=1 Tax=Petrocella sp. FN5 TaxID=3032002 RepID=UPI0023D9D8A0|nr:NCS2 family permease [Petrocella sp. FN5]MDF1617813.1 NCS2 family permease [Petrocella sp. FN5]
MEKFFKLKEHGTNVSTELLAGLTTFMTMAYILIVNPNILSVTGMDKNALFTATAVAAIVGTLCMALFANYPFALAPGMGLNAYFAFSVVIGLGYSWEIALTAVFVEGIIFILLTAVNIREALFNAIPLNLKYAVSAGIGLFIAFIGFQNAGIVVGDEATLVALGDLTSLPVVLSIIGILLTGLLVVKKVKGAILIGILGTWILAMITELLGWYVPDFVATFPTIPSAIMQAPPSLAPIFFQLDFSQVLTLDFLVVVFAFLFVDLFDTLGTLIGVSSKAGFLDEKGNLPKAKQALFADAVATTVGAVLGTSTTTTYIESAAGVSDGGRTGLTAVSTAALFAVALFFSPIFLAVPAFATAPALIIVGFYMMESVAKITFSDYSEAIPAFLTMIVMPLTYSISDGIVFGFVSYTIINLLAGKANKLSILMYVVSILMVVNFII